MLHRLQHLRVPFTYALALLAFTLVVPSTTQAQSGPRWYHNIDSTNVAIGGYDVVAYFTDSTATLGSADHEIVVDDVRYRFANAEHARQFETEPNRYLPQYGGWCALFAGVPPENPFGIAPGRFTPDPTNFAIHDDKLYLLTKGPTFDARPRWQAAPANFIARADTFWSSRVGYGERFPEKPEGLNPIARMENLDWAFFIGKWRGQARSMVNVETKQYSPPSEGIWTAYFGFEGYGIQDDWVPQQIWPGWSGPAIRGYDPLNDVWNMFFIPLNSPVSNTWQMQGRFDEGGNMRGSFEGVDAAGRPFKQKIHFYNISENSFSWKADRSYDDGETWIEKFMYTECERIE